jgi:hypothetical protein
VRPNSLLLPAVSNQAPSDLIETACVAQIARWEKNRAMGRRDFVFRRGVLGWGVPAALITIVYKVVQEQGFVTAPQLTAALRTAIIVALVVFPLCGWIFGRWLWTAGEARYSALVRDATGLSR